MKSAWVFFTNVGFTMEHLKNYSKEVKEKVNDVEELLKTQIFVNEEVLNRYTYCRVVMDEIIDISGRAFNKELQSVVVNNSYDVYVDNESGKIICLCSKQSVNFIKEVFEEMLKIRYSAYTFDLNSIINDSSNVKRAQFRNLSIQTLNSGMIKGNRVNDTEMFLDMLQNGDLSNIIVMYPFGNQDISISVSSSGSLLLYTHLQDSEFIQLIHNLIE